MKTAEEMVKAIRDWVNRLIKKSGEEMGKQIETLVKEVDPDTILRKTGDASKVITTFSMHRSMVLPESGESLDITIRKIMKWLDVLDGGVAVSGSYKDLWDRPVKAEFKADIKAIDAAEVIPLVDFAGSEILAERVLSDIALIYGAGGLVTAAKEGTTDFVRIYLAYRKEPDSATNVGGGWTLVQLGSLGSTARWSLAVKLTTASSYRQSVTLNVPKGSWAEVNILSLPRYEFEN